MIGNLLFWFFSNKLNDIGLRELAENLGTMLKLKNLQINLSKYSYLQFLLFFLKIK
jgi:hypothetical protein